MNPFLILIFIERSTKLNCRVKTQLNDVISVDFVVNQMIVIIANICFLFGDFLKFHGAMIP